MARIRSVHPGQWTDEEYVSCSMTARLFAIALRNEADDQGVFPWKPLTLKMRLFPADDVDISALLDELAAADVIQRFELDGRAFGAIRNFARYQRPKKPTYTHVLPAALRSYVCLTADTLAGNSSAPSPNRSEQVPNHHGAVPEHCENARPEEEKEGEKGKGNRKGEAVPIGTPPGDDDAKAQEPSASGDRWHGALEWLATHTNRRRAGLRSLIGRWCRDYGERAVRVVLDEAARSPPADPVAWLEARLKRDHRLHGTRDPLNEWLAHEDETRNQDPGI